MAFQFLYKGLSINYTKEGSGKAIVLLHGFGEDSSVWAGQLNALQNNFTVINIDLPGSGKSTINNDASMLESLSTIEFYAECVYALLVDLSIEKCSMFGHSMGGYITLAFAEKYETMLNGFGLVHSTAYADSAEKKINRQRGIDLIEQYGSYAFLKTTMPNLFSTAFKIAKPQVIDALIDAGKDFTVTALQNYYRAMMNRLDRTAVLKGSKLPILFIIGTDDVAIPIKDSLEQSHMPKYAYIHVLENGGHMSMIENPEIVTNFFQNFLSDISE
jgi:pimeloyl-ACP methyl ester carboxylesterase